MNISVALDGLAARFQGRLNRYRLKALKATGTDKINQGAKIKATIECLQDVNRVRNNLINGDGKQHEGTDKPGDGSAAPDSHGKL
jgi:hypothetical protein